ncbi:hypothetical protein JL720_16948 [Aureococcus anophagefferens]|nr:hypothetical protein JL720_16948 [Aureococcus anophagefferens]
MSVVCVFSAPIGVVSSGEILEAALPPLAPGGGLFLRRLAVRRGVRAGRGGVPVFALIVALVGCLAVSFLSFVLPPYLHLKLALSWAGSGRWTPRRCSASSSSSSRVLTALDGRRGARAAAPPPVVQSG